MWIIRPPQRLHWLDTWKHDEEEIPYSLIPFKGGRASSPNVGSCVLMHLLGSRIGPQDAIDREPLSEN